MPTIDFAIDETTRDLVFDGQQFGFNLGRRAIAQRLLIKFGTFLGEWFLDVTAGIPYREEVLVRAPDEAVLSALFRQNILETTGVTGISEFALALQPASRGLSVSFVATTDEGELPVTLGPDPLQPSMFVLLFDDSRLMVPS